MFETASIGVALAAALLVGAPVAACRLKRAKAIRQAREMYRGALRPGPSAALRFVLLGMMDRDKLSARDIGADPETLEEWKQNRETARALVRAIGREEQGPAVA